MLYCNCSAQRSLYQDTPTLCAHVIVSSLLGPLPLSASAATIDSGGCKTWTVDWTHGPRFGLGFRLFNTGWGVRCCLVNHPIGSRWCGHGWLCLIWLDCSSWKPIKAGVGVELGDRPEDKVRNTEDVGEG